MADRKLKSVRAAADTDAVKLRVIEIVKGGVDSDAIKKDLLSEFGSLEIPVVVFWWLKQQAAAHREIQDQAGELAARGDKLWRHILNDVVDALKDIERWDQAAASGQDVLKSELEKHLDNVRRMIHSWYGIMAHRPIEAQARDAWIVQRRIIGGLSFGQIAIEYNKQMERDGITDREGKVKTITPNVVGLAYKRACENYVDDLIKMFHPRTRSKTRRIKTN